MNYTRKLPEVLKKVPTQVIEFLQFVSAGQRGGWIGNGMLKAGFIRKFHKMKSFHVLLSQVASRAQQNLNFFAVDI